MRDKWCGVAEVKRERKGGQMQCSKQDPRRKRKTRKQAVT